MKDVSLKVDIPMRIERHEGRWLVNGSRYENLTAAEKDFLSKFIIHMKEAYELENEIYTYEKKNVKVDSDNIFQSSLNKLTNNK